MSEIDDTALQRRVNALTLERKVLLLTGRDIWSTWPIPEIGLRPIVVSDGPSGVRGARWDEREPSLNLPSATALSSSWDPDIARRYGAACAAEARRKGVHVVLGPTINLHRSPLGGRHFEAFSEDPRLTADLAAAYVTGLQENGVGAALKHYVCNDFETDRFTVDVRVSERALREVYLLAFERAVVESRAWLVMSAYNGVNGARATENDLLQTPLKDEWGFDGVVVSDWTAVRSLESARHAQDLVMPGPEGPWGDALVAAVRAGEIEEKVVDRKVLRLLRLAARVGALDGVGPERPAPARAEDGVALAREAASAGTVLLRNDGALPCPPGDVARIAVIGQNAEVARTQGGGSATVVPARVVSPLDGIRAAYPDAEVTYTLGAVVQEEVAALAPERLVNPVTGGPGVHVRFLDAGGRELAAEERLATDLVWLGGDAPIARSARLELRTRYTPATSGPVRLGFAAVGTGRVSVDGRPLFAETVEPTSDDVATLLLAPPSASRTLHLAAGVPVDIHAEYDLADRTGPLAHTLSFRLGTAPVPDDADDLVAAAADAARAADIAVVVVGTTPTLESEGFDRTSLDLPGRQDDLVRAVAAANPRTVVVVNAGAPVLLPWREQVAAVLVTYFGGQEYGHALADILTGRVEPGGRLPTTWPAATEDTPVLAVTPVDGTVRYDEGVHVGHRAWLRAGTTPAYPFGHGLGYTTWELARLDVDPTLGADGAATIHLTVANTGARTGKQVVQVYAERPESRVDRPERWLVAHAPVWAEPGGIAPVTLTVPARALAHWDGGWRHEPGDYTLRVGFSATDLRRTTTVTLFDAPDRTAA